VRENKEQTLKGKPYLIHRRSHSFPPLPARPWLPSLPGDPAPLVFPGSPALPRDRAVPQHQTVPRRTEYTETSSCRRTCSSSTCSCPTLLQPMSASAEGERPRAGLADTSWLGWHRTASVCHRATSAWSRRVCSTGNVLQFTVDRFNPLH